MAYKNLVIARECNWKIIIFLQTKNKLPYLKLNKSNKHAKFNYQNFKCNFVSLR
jgi:hypothetical protein